MCMCALLTWMLVQPVCALTTVQKWASDPLEPELQMTVSCNVEAGNQTRLQEQPVLLPIDPFLWALVFVVLVRLFCLFVFYIFLSLQREKIERLKCNTYDP